jgi:hypothetical protein
LRRWLSLLKPGFPAGGTGNKEAFLLENAMLVVPDALARASACAGRRTWLYLRLEHLYSLFMMSLYSFNPLIIEDIRNKLLTMRTQA